MDTSQGGAKSGQRGICDLLPMLHLATLASLHHIHEQTKDSGIYKRRIMHEATTLKLLWVSWYYSNRWVTGIFSSSGTPLTKCPPLGVVKTVHQRSEARTYGGCRACQNPRPVEKSAVSRWICVLCRGWSSSSNLGWAGDPCTLAVTLHGSSSRSWRASGNQPFFRPLWMAKPALPLARLCEGPGLGEPVKGIDTKYTCASLPWWDSQA